MHANLQKKFWYMRKLQHTGVNRETGYNISKFPGSAEINLILRENPKHIVVIALGNSLDGDISLDLLKERISEFTEAMLKDPQQHLTVVQVFQSEPKISTVVRSEMYLAMQAEKVSVETCLSPHVHQLICTDCLHDCHTENQHSDDCNMCPGCSNCLTPDGLLNSDYINSILQSDTVEETSADYRSCVIKLAPVLCTVHNSIKVKSNDSLKESYGEHFEWTNSKTLLVECFNDVQDAGSRCLLSLMRVTSILERALGDVYLLQGIQCPSLLKDLLSANELAATLGQSVIRILRILIGPPVSLNLRNLIWHGFPEPAEIHPQYLSVLLVLTASIGAILARQGLVTMISHRCPVSITAADKITERIPTLQICPLDTWLCQELPESRFMLRQMTPLWKLAVSLFQQGRYGLSACLCCPLLENGLRLVFTACNNCSHRILTAESTTLYTTFDEMLSTCLPDGQQNQLFGLLPQAHMDLLHDLLVYPDGPRLRDHLSHGEVDIDSVTKDTATAAMTAVAMFTLAFSDHLSSENLIVLENFQAYESVFHPVSILKDQILSLSHKLLQWESWVHISPDLTVHEHEERSQISAFKCLIEQSTELTECFLLLCKRGERLKDKSTQIEKILIHGDVERKASGDAYISWQSECHREVLTKLHTVSHHHTATAESTTDDIHQIQSAASEDYRNTSPTTSTKGSTGEIIGLLRRITSEAAQTSDNVKCVVAVRQSQLEARELRSRQRETVKRMLTSLPCISFGLWTVLEVCVQICTEVTASKYSCDKHDTVDIKFLKATLQYCENLKSNTNINKNKWTESVSLTYSYFERINKVWL